MPYPHVEPSCATPRRLRPRARLVAAIAVLTAAVLWPVAAPGAGAGTSRTTNACLYSLDDVYRDQPVTLTGTSTVKGDTVRLAGATLAARLPSLVPRAGFELGIFGPGRNLVPSRVWIAIEGSNVAPARRVFALRVTASTTISVGEDGSFASATPIEVKLRIPSSTWRITSPGPARFAQAGPGSLPRLPVGREDALQAVKGSIVVAPRLARLRFVMDCQPGTASRDGSKPDVRAAAAFSTAG